MSLLKIENLTVEAMETRRKVVQNVSLSCRWGIMTALVGGSGSGKSTTGLAVLRLLPPGLRISGGRILFKDQNVLSLASAKLPSLRGHRISMVFQDPLSSLNPVFRVGTQVDEVLQAHLRLSARERREHILALFHRVGLSDPERVAASYPHQLSGGMRQRVMIAQAIAAGPDLLIADEPTSNLDVTLQAHILALFRELQREMKLTILLITHDLGLVRHICDDVFVMSRGEIVEHGPVETVMTQPEHPYTRQLLEAVAGGGQSCF